MTSLLARIGTLTGCVVLMACGSSPAAPQCFIAPGTKQNYPRMAPGQDSLYAYVDEGIASDTVQCQLPDLDLDSLGLWVVDLRTGSRTRLMSGLPQFDFSWFPQGDALVVPNDSGFTLVNIRTLANSTVVIRPGINYPAWSPDGRLIAYNVFSSFGGDSLFLYDVAAHTSRFLTLGLSGPVWSPSSDALIGRNGGFVAKINAQPPIFPTFPPTLGDGVS